MLRSLFLGTGLLALALSGCGDPPMAKVKGRILENGQPKTFPATSHSVEITPLDESGTPNKGKAFTAVVNEDGTFQVIASGGLLPVGTYTFAVRGMFVKKKGGAEPPASKRELKSGDNNDITLDLAKPGE
jgi:hypothetical protein